MRMRIFGGDQCRDCLELFVILNKYNVDYEYIDAFDEDTQEFCDENNVDELPHVQFIEDETIIIEHKGAFDEEEFMQCLAIYFPTY